MNIFYLVSTISRYLTSFLFLIILTGQVNEIDAQNAAINFSDIDVNALREEVKHVEDFLQNLPPEERRRLEEEVMREVEKLSEEDFQQILDLSEKIAQPEAPAPQPAAPLPQKPLTEPEQKPVSRDQQSDERHRTEIRTVLETIIGKIDTTTNKINKTI